MLSEKNLNSTSFREQLISWLDAVSRPVGIRDYGATPTEHDIIAAKEWQAILWRDGWAGLSWPLNFGGKNLPPVEQAIFAEEVAKRDLPRQLNIVSHDLVGPVLIEYGSEEQKSFHLTPILSGESIWCQLFSEPNAGSDLANIMTTASRVDDGWILNGQKVWTSGAHYSDYGLLLARTGGSADSYRGLTCFVLPMHRDGVTVRPLKQMDGETKFNEVFFDDVKLFDSDILGEVGKGWKVAMSTLGRERLSLAAQSTIIFDKIGALSQIVSKDETSIGKFMSLSLVDVWARTYMLRLTWLRSFASQENAWLSQIVKLTASDIQKSLGDVGSSIEGSTSMLLSDDSFMSKHVLYAVGTSIAGGTSEIQKNIVAERILGMPK